MNDKVALWAERGEILEINGRRVFYWERGSGPTLVALHGFPSSSHDWRFLADRLPARRFIAMDLLGFGLSDKSKDGDYSLSAQADLVEGLLDRLGVDSCDLVAHDMGDSVVAELLARSTEGRLTFDARRAVLMNGGIFIDLVQMTGGQKLFLRLPNVKLPFQVPVNLFRGQLRRTFSEQHQPVPLDLLMIELLLMHAGGARLLPRTIRYQEERRTYEARLTGGLVDWTGPLSLIWGEADEVTVPAIADHLVYLRPSTEDIRWRDVGHWPHLEVPERVAAELERILG